MEKVAFRQIEIEVDSMNERQFSGTPSSSGILVFWYILFF